MLKTPAGGTILGKKPGVSLGGSCFGILNFEFVSDFEIRISNFLRGKALINSHPLH
jgi:hypothetical protein